MDAVTTIDRAESDGVSRGPALRPRDAATLILLDRSAGSEVSILMGRRHARHVFMPGKFVFPGGRPDDGRVPTSDDLHQAEADMLGRLTGIRNSSRARAIALSAIRETYEEAGLLVGRRCDYRCGIPGWTAFAEHGVEPTLSPLRLIARAITPPGRVRRFDTRFFACWRSSVAVELPEGGPTDELEEIVWMPIAKAIQADIPGITRQVLEHLQARLAEDPILSPGGPVPFFRFVRNRFTRDLL